MDSFEFNKIIGWTLAALLVIFGGRTFIDIYNGGHGDGAAEKSAYAIEVTADKAGKPTEKKKEAAVDIKPLLAGANLENGAKMVKRCTACHSITKGGANKTGPGLYEIVNRKIAAVGDFVYSDALKAKKGAWNYDQLAAFLRKPKDYAPGTAMRFGGIKNDNKLADLILFLRSKSDSPAKLP